MHSLLKLVAGLSLALTSVAQIVPVTDTDPGQSATLNSKVKRVNGKAVNVVFNAITSTPNDYDVVTKLGTELIFQLRDGTLYQQQQTSTGDYADTGLVGGIELFAPPLLLFQFRNASNLKPGSDFEASTDQWYLSQVGATGSTYNLLATTEQQSNGFYACLTPDKPPTRFAVDIEAKKSHYAIFYSAGGGTPPNACSKVRVRTTLV